MARLIVSKNTTGDYAGDDTDVADTFIWGYPEYQSANYGTDGSVRCTKWYSNEDVRSSLLWFDLSSLPSGCTVNSIELGLYCHTTPGVAASVYARRLLVPWVESEATWLIRSTGTNWSTSGALGDGVDRDPAVVGNIPSGLGWAIANDSGLADWVQGVVDGGYSNYGLILEIASSDLNGYENDYYSSEGTDGLRPYLSIDYTEGGRISAEQTESLSLSDALSAGRKTYASCVEFLELSDITAAAAFRVASIVESLLLSDLLSVASADVALVAESFGLSDIVSATVVARAEIIESLGLSDSQGASKATSVEISETIALSDITSFVDSAVVAISESLALSDEYVAKSRPQVLSVRFTYSSIDPEPDPVTGDLIDIVYEY